MSKYQELKKHLLTMFEKQLSILHGDNKTEHQEATSSSSASAILANLKIEIEKTYVRFEDE